MTILSGAAMALGLVLAQPQATPLTPDDAADVQCFALFAVVSGRMGENAPERVGLAGGMMYHLGRLEGRTPGVDWLDRIGVYLAETDLRTLDDQRARCAQSLTSKGAAMVEWGESLQLRATAP